VEATILPSIYQLIQFPILQGSALESILQFFVHLLTFDPSKAPKVLSSLLETMENSQSQVQHYSTVAQCIGAVVKAVPKVAGSIIEQVEKVFAKGKEGVDVYVHLLIVGEIGRVQDLSGNKPLFDRVLTFYEAQSEEIKSAAAFAIGNMAVGNLEAFLPIVESQIQDDNAKRRLLSLQALKELISHGKDDQLRIIAERIWVLYFKSVLRRMRLSKTLQQSVLLA
jgi:cullin-associated NEDD8-dissociated protein 1